MDERDLEEERRLAYVAFTRARKRLFLCRPKSRRVYGGAPEPVSASRFLKEIPPDHIVRARGLGIGPTTTIPVDARSRLDDFLKKHTAAPVQKPDLAPRIVMEPEDGKAFKRGTRVMHGEFGEGEIKSVTGSPSNPKLVVHFHQAGRKTLLARFAGLEILVE